MPLTHMLYASEDRTNNVQLYRIFEKIKITEVMGSFWLIKPFEKHENKSEFAFKDCCMFKNSTAVK